VGEQRFLLGSEQELIRRVGGEQRLDA